MPKIESASYDNVIAGGLGGSALAIRALFFLDPSFPIWLHDSYDLPVKCEGETLFIAVSYSGNTAETLSFAKKALEEGRQLAVVTSGGELERFAKDNGAECVSVPPGLQPREAVLPMLKAILNILGRDDLLEGIEKISLDTQSAYERGKKTGEEFLEKIPLVYSSSDNRCLAYIWKVMLNETAKIPAFSNYFPEVRHNEVQGLVSLKDGRLKEGFKYLLLLDSEDDERIRREMKVFGELASSSDSAISKLDMPFGRADKLVFTLSAASGAAHAIAERSGVTPEEVPFIELFKKSLL